MLSAVVYARVGRVNRWGGGRRSRPRGCGSGKHDENGLYSKSLSS